VFPIADLVVGPSNWRLWAVLNLSNLLRSRIRHIGTQVSLGSEPPCGSAAFWEKSAD
ncbi:uncharacterized protein METZ01_LOCUS144441, partial [marine metagenome]